MLNMGFVTRTTSSPILGRSKSPRRVQHDTSPSSAHASPRINRNTVNIGASKYKSDSVPKCPLAGHLQAVAETNHHSFPHFQPPLSHEIVPSKKTASLGCCSLSKKSPKLRTMYPCDLATKLEKPDKVLLIDCRSFIAFNINHIHGALNVSCCDRLTKKRLQCAKVQIGDLVSPGQEAKEEFFEKRGSSSTPVVLYDDSTEELDKLSLTSPLQLVISALHREGVDSFVLKGGLSSFQSRYSHLCAKPSNKPTNSPLFSPTTPLIHSEIDSATISQILPFLYIGNERDAASKERLQEVGITHVLNVTSHLPLNFDGDECLTYCRLAASDSAHQNLTQYFDDAFKFIDEARTSGGKVMIHCQAGVSRSSTIVIAYLMKYSGLTMTAAFRYVKSKRAIIAPNFNFMGQLMEFEQQLEQGQITRDLALKLTLDDDTV